MHPLVSFRTGRLPVHIVLGRLMATLLPLVLAYEGAAWFIGAGLGYADGSGGPRSEEADTPATPQR